MMQMSFVYGKSSDVCRKKKNVEGGLKLEAALIQQHRLKKEENEVSKHLKKD